MIPFVTRVTPHANPTNLLTQPPSRLARWSQDEEYLAEEDDALGGSLVVPTSLLKGSLENGNKGDPGKLTAAIHALRYALKSSDEEVRIETRERMEGMKTVCILGRLTIHPTNASIIPPAHFACRRGSH